MASQRRGPGEGSIYKRKDGRWVAQVPSKGPADAGMRYCKTRSEAATVHAFLLLQRDARFMAGTDSRKTEELCRLFGRLEELLIGELTK